MTRVAPTAVVSALKTCAAAWPWIRRALWPPVVPPAQVAPVDLTPLERRMALAIDRAVDERAKIARALGVPLDADLVDETDKVVRENLALRQRLGFRPKRGTLGRP